MNFSKWFDDKSPKNEDKFDKQPFMQLRKI